MGFIRDAIVDASKTLGISLVELSRDQRDVLVQQIRNQFTNGRSSYPIWEDIVECAFLESPDGWEWIANFDKVSPLIVFFNGFDDISAFEFVSGDQIVSVLSETFGFEFYVTGRETDFIICFNHHDYLSGAGNALDWIIEQAEIRKHTYESYPCN